MDMQEFLQIAKRKNILILKGILIIIWYNKLLIKKNPSISGTIPTGY